MIILCVMCFSLTLLWPRKSFKKTGRTIKRKRNVCGSFFLTQNDLFIGWMMALFSWLWIAETTGHPCVIKRPRCILQRPQTRNNHAVVDIVTSWFHLVTYLQKTLISLPVKANASAPQPWQWSLSMYRSPGSVKWPLKNASMTVRERKLHLNLTLLHYACKYIAVTLEAFVKESSKNFEGFAFFSSI